MVFTSMQTLEDLQGRLTAVPIEEGRSRLVAKGEKFFESGADADSSSLPAFAAFSAQPQTNGSSSQPTAQV